jgi:hypothetical protein
MDWYKRYFINTINVSVVVETTANAPLTSQRRRRPTCPSLRGRRSRRRCTCELRWDATGKALSRRARWRRQHPRGRPGRDNSPIPFRRSWSSLMSEWQRLDATQLLFGSRVSRPNLALLSYITGSLVNGKLNPHNKCRFHLTLCRTHLLVSHCQWPSEFLGDLKNSTNHGF